jgi:hypothetical protein
MIRNLALLRFYGRSANARSERQAFVKHRSLLSLSLTIAACAFFTARSEAQKNDPDFSNVNDILQGNRTLLQISDLQAAATLQNGANLTLYQFTTSNSSVTKTSTTPAGIPEKVHDSQSFSGWMFNQPQAVTVTTATESGSRKLVTQNLPNREPWVTTYASSHYGVQAGAMADFNLDGYDDLVLSYADGSVQVVTAGDVNNPNAGTYPPFNVGPVSKLNVLFSMTVGDFNGDGRPEIAGVFPQNGGLKLVIYTVDPKSLAITPASSILLPTPEATPPTWYTSIARGKFNTLAHDQLAVAVGWKSGPTRVQIVDFKPDSLLPVAQPALTVSTVTRPFGYIEVKTGQFAFPNPYDQIVFHSSSTTNGGRFFEILSVDAANLTLRANPPVTYNQFPCAAGIQVGNFDHQQPDPLNPGKNQHNPNAQIAFMYCNAQATDYVLNIYSVATGPNDPNTFNIVDPPDSQTPVPIPVGHTSLVATDIQGRSVVLGEPTKIVVQDTAQPSVIAAMPPMHVDFIPPVAGQAPTLLNLSAIPDGFRTVYETNETNSSQSSNTNTTSYSFGTQLTVEAGLEIGDVEGGLGLDVSSTTRAAQDNKTTFEKEYGQYRSSEFDASVKTGLADQVWYTDSRFNIYVYPVIGQTACPKPNCTEKEKVPLTIQFSGPDKAESHKVDGNLIPWYQPVWEPGNVFSYPATYEQLQRIVPQIHLLSKAQSSRTDTSTATERASWTTQTTEGATAGVDQNYSFEQEFSVSGAVSYGIVSGSAGLALNLSGSSGFSNLSKAVTSVGRSAGIGIEKPGTFLVPASYNYLFTPYIFGETKPNTVIDNEPLGQDVTTFGLLRTAFTADPARNDAGGWWKQAYHSAPDVALNHPSRWHRTPPPDGAMPPNCLNSGSGSTDCINLQPSRPDNLWESNFHVMRGFFISNARSPGKGPQLTTTKAGDKLTLQARVYNYSFTPMPAGSTVHVRFYTQEIDKDNQHKPVGDGILINDADVMLPPIPPFSDDDGAPLNWVLASTNFDTTGYDSKYLIFWVVVWIEDGNGKLVPEVEGHGLRSIPGNLKSLADVQTEEYSNNVGFYNSVFYVFPAQSSARSAAVGDELATIEIVNAQLSEKRVIQGQVVDVSAELIAENNSASGISALFYDGDPHSDGTVFGLEQIPYIAENGTYQVEAPYNASACGKHDLFVVVHEGTPNEVLWRIGKLKINCAR